MSTRPLWPRTRQRLFDGSDMTMPVPQPPAHPVMPSTDTPEGDNEMMALREAMLSETVPELYGAVEDYEQNNDGPPRRITREYSQAIDRRMSTMSLHERIDLELSRSGHFERNPHSYDYDPLSYTRQSTYDPLASDLAPDGHDNHGAEMLQPSGARVTRPRGWYGK